MISGVELHTTLATTAIEITGDRIGVLNAFTLDVSNSPLLGVTLRANTDGTSVLSDNSCKKHAPDHERATNPHGLCLEPGLMPRVFVCKITIIVSVEHTGRQKNPSFPGVTYKNLNTKLEWIMSKVFFY